MSGDVAHRTVEVIGRVVAVLMVFARSWTPVLGARPQGPDPTACDDGDMLVRRLVYAICALLLLLAIGSALAQRERDRTQAAAPPLSSGKAPSAPAPETAAEMPPDKVVRARVGEVVSITVRTPQPETATIRAAGVSELAS